MTAASGAAVSGWAGRWGLFWALTGGLAAMSLGFLFVIGWDTDGYRMVIRATARTLTAQLLGGWIAGALARAPFPLVRCERDVMARLRPPSRRVAVVMLTGASALGSALL